MKEIFYNTTYQKLFKKNDCPENLGSEEMFVVPEAQFCSDISQAVNRYSTSYHACRSTLRMP